MSRGPSEQVNILIGEAVTSRLFLVQEVGPTGFVIRGEDNQKFTVFLGAPHQCSCKKPISGLCIHILFVLLKVLKVPRDSPFAWKANLIDADITRVLEGRFQKRAASRKSHIRLKKHSSLAKKLPIEAGDTCPICCEEFILDENQSISFCRRSCGQNVHSKCMEVWALHQSSIGSSVTCPLCRGDWGVTAILDIQKDMKLAEKKLKQSRLHNGIRCFHCQSSPISGNRYHCAVCSCFDLCESCFKGKRHGHGHHPCVKITNNSGNFTSWAPAPHAVIKVSSEQLLDELQHREITSSDFELLSQLDAPEDPPLCQFLAEALPPFPIYGSSDRNDYFCVSCSHCISTNSSIDPYSVRQLFCGHLIHHACLYSELMYHPDAKCPVVSCRLPIFQGLQPNSITSQSVTKETQAEPGVETTPLGVAGTGIRSFRVSSPFLSETQRTSKVSSPLIVPFYVRTPMQKHTEESLIINTTSERTLEHKPKTPSLVQHDGIPYWTLVTKKQQLKRIHTAPTTPTKDLTAPFTIHRQLAKSPIQQEPRSSIHSNRVASSSSFINLHFKSPELVHIIGNLDPPLATKIAINGLLKPKSISVIQKKPKVNLNAAANSTQFMLNSSILFEDRHIFLADKPSSKKTIRSSHLVKGLASKRVR